MAHSLEVNELRNMQNNCTLKENYSTELTMLVEFEMNIEIQNWVDPYDSFWLKLITFLVYIIEIFGSLIMYTFVLYETRGYAGPYRTFINQLLSYLYLMVSKEFCGRHLLMSF